MILKFVTVWLTFVALEPKSYANVTPKPLVAVKADMKNVPSRYRSYLGAIGLGSNACTYNHHGSGLVSTAGHCMTEIKDLAVVDGACSDLTIIWGYRQTSFDSVSRCSKVIYAMDGRLEDYALLLVSPPPADKIPVDSNWLVNWTDEFTIFSHASSRPLQWSGICSPKPKTSVTVEDFFSHHCPTEGGSSGAAILFSANSTMVGIHTAQYSWEGVETHNSGQQLRHLNQFQKCFAGKGLKDDSRYRPSGAYAAEQMLPRVEDKFRSQIARFADFENPDEQIVVRFPASEADVLTSKSNDQLVFEVSGGLNVVGLELQELGAGGAVSLIGNATQTGQNMFEICLVGLTPGVKTLQLTAIDDRGTVLGTRVFRLPVAF